MEFRFRVQKKFEFRIDFSKFGHRILKNRCEIQNFGLVMFVASWPREVRETRWASFVSFDRFVNWTILLVAAVVVVVVVVVSY